MEYVAFLMEHGNMGFSEVMKLPITIFASLLKQFYIKEMMQNEEYRKQYEKLKYIDVEEGNLDIIRQASNYRIKRE